MTEIQLLKTEQELENLITQTRANNKPFFDEIDSRAEKMDRAWREITGFDQGFNKLIPSLYSIPTPAALNNQSWIGYGLTFSTLFFLESAQEKTPEYQFLLHYRQNLGGKRIIADSPEKLAIKARETIESLEIFHNHGHAQPTFCTSEGSFYVLTPNDLSRVSDMVQVVAIAERVPFQMSSYRPHRGLNLQEQGAFLESYARKAA